MNANNLKPLTALALLCGSLITPLISNAATAPCQTKADDSPASIKCPPGRTKGYSGYCTEAPKFVTPNNNSNTALRCPSGYTWKYNYKEPTGILTSPGWIIQQGTWDNSLYDASNNRYSMSTSLAFSIANQLY